MKIKKIMVFLLVAVISITAFAVPVSAATKKVEAVSNVIVDEIGHNYIKISWDKVSGASKYAVYYSTKYDSGYKKYTTVSKPTVTIKKLKKNTKYYIKIKTLKTTNGKTYSSGYCKEIMLRTRKTKLTEEVTFDGTQDKYGNFNIICGDCYVRILPRMSLIGKLNNRYSEYHGKKVVAVYADVYNLSEKTTRLNSFRVNFFSPTGKQIDDLQYYFDFGDYVYNDILPGKSTAGFFIMPYDKIGKYSINFGGGYSENDVLVQFDIDRRVLSDFSSEEVVSEWLDGMIEKLNE